MMGTYFMMFAIYSFCNVHDVSWGTRDAHHTADSDQKRMEAIYKSFRSELVVAWVTFNLLYATTIVQTDAKLFFIVFFGGTSMMLVGFQLLGSTLYVLFKCCKKIVS